MSDFNPPTPYQQHPQPGHQQGDSKMVDPPPPYPGLPGSTPVYGSYGAVPPPGQQPSHAFYMAPGQHIPTTTMYTSAIPTSGTTTTVIITGNCPRCHVGHMREESNAAMCILVAILALLFFPIGLLYFLCLPAAIVHTCDHCGYTY